MDPDPSASPIHAPDSPSREQTLGEDIEDIEDIYEKSYDAQMNQQWFPIDAEITLARPPKLPQSDANMTKSPSNDHQIM